MSYSNKRKRPRYDSDDTESLSDKAEAAYQTLVEMFPSKSKKYLKEKAVNWSGERMEALVEQLLVEGVDNDKSVIMVEDSSQELGDEVGGSQNNSFVEEDLTGMADTSIPIDDDNQTVDLGQSSSSSSKVTNYIENNYSTLCSLFPDVSPIFLQEQAWEIGDDTSKLEAFISNSLERKSSLPSKKEYEKEQLKLSEMKKIRGLTANDFLDQYTDPHQFFLDTTSTVSQLYKEHAVFYITKHFPLVPVSAVQEALAQHNGHFIPTLKQVENFPVGNKKGKKVAKKSVPQKPKEMDLQFLKEYVYYKLEPKIRKVEARKEKKKAKAVEEARKVGGLFECQICFDSDCLVADVAMCEKGCMFCRDCVRRGAEVQIGDSKSVISCLTNCGDTIPVGVLQVVLPTTMFSKLVQRMQLEEVQAAALDDLVQCPACSFATVMPNPEDKVLVCGNPECGRESCRLCGEESHVPLTCDEVEKDGEVVARTKLEDAMTEAMLRECVSCKKRFFKEEGCNKMQCECGQAMCYLCRQPVGKDYTHFYGQGASPLKGKCPLWSDNTNLHKAEVLKAAEKAKTTVDTKKLKYDPTKNMEKPPDGFDPKALHNNFGQNGEYLEEGESDDSDEDDDGFIVEDEDDYYDFDGFIIRDFVDLEDEDEEYFDGYRANDWL